MKKGLLNLLTKFGGCIAVLSLGVTTIISNSACGWLSYQEKMPETAKKLRKF